MMFTYSAYTNTMVYTIIMYDIIAGCDTGGGGGGGDFPPLDSDQIYFNFVLN